MRRRQGPQEEGGNNEEKGENDNEEEEENDNEEEGENDKEEQEGGQDEEGQQQLSRAVYRLCSFLLKYLSMYLGTTPREGWSPLGIYIFILPESRCEVPLAAKNIR